MKFVSYNQIELAQAGRTFVEAFRSASKQLSAGQAHTSEWTECVLNWFAGTVADGHRVDARRLPPPPRGSSSREVVSALKTIGGSPRGTSREFMFDLCHSTWLPDEQVDYWSAALQKKPTLQLVLESENGKANNGPANVSAIMEDAAKLLHVTATSKVVVFASRDAKDRAAILGLAKLLSLADTQAEPQWLWLDLPWPDWTDSFAPDGWLFDKATAKSEPRSVCART